MEVKSHFRPPGQLQTGLQEKGGNSELVCEQGIHSAAADLGHRDGCRPVCKAENSCKAVQRVDNAAAALKPPERLAVSLRSTNTAERQQNLIHGLHYHQQSPNIYACRTLCFV
jgi:hypothetical protein